MFVTSLIATLVFVQAPSDVPKEHWAFPAVDSLFREGLLNGYPSGKQPLVRLDKTVKPDLKKAQKWKIEWEKKGLLAGYPDMCGYRDPSNYELAVMAHAFLSFAKDEIRTGKTSMERLESFRQEFQRLGEVISMFHTELTKLGADPQEMIVLLNNLNDSPNRLFHGDRR